MALFEALIEHGVLRDRADGLFVAEQLRLAREVLGAALPPIAIVTNLSPPGEQVYVRPLEAPVHPLRQARKKCRSRPGRTASIYVTPALLLGTLTGSRVDRKLNRDRFRTIVTAMILMLGLSLALGLGRR